MLRDFLICLSLVNLWFLNAWEDLQSLQSRSLDYVRKSAARQTLFVATVSDVLLVAAILFIVIRLVRRSSNFAALRLAQCAFLGTLAITMEAIRRMVTNPVGHFLLTPFGNGVWVAVEVTFVLGAALLLLCQFDFVLRLGMTLLLLFAPLFPIAVGHLMLTRTPASAFSDKPTSPALATGRAAQTRVVWLILDEMDQRLAFTERPEVVRLPELDRLRARAIYAGNAVAAGGMTLEAMPALILGRQISKAQPVGADELMITFEGFEHPVRLSLQPTVFSKAREMGFNAAIAGWYHPYCRILSRSLTECSWEPAAGSTPLTRRQEHAGEIGLLLSMGNQLRRELQRIRFLRRFDIVRGDSIDRQETKTRREHHADTFLRQRNLAMRMLSDPGLDLVVIHFPVPHPPGIYNRFTGEISLDENNNYVDNLYLVDRTIGELRRAMEKAGTWERTTLIITADHALRPSIWAHEGMWTSEEEALSGGEDYALVPFLIKLRNQEQGISYSRPFSSILIHDLTLALLRNEISDPESALRWLDAHRDRIPIS